MKKTKSNTFMAIVAIILVVAFLLWFVVLDI